MRFSSTLAGAITALCSFSALVQGHSRSREPLNYLSLVDSPVINTPSHRVHAHSEFEVTFTIHRGAQKIRLTLEPSEDILYEGATVHYVDGQGRELKRELIDRSAHKVFHGTSWREVRGREGFWERAGDASLSVYRDGKTPLFEGAFGLGLDDHTIQLRSHYQATKHENDVDLEPTEDDYMLVWRNQDISTADISTQTSLVDSPQYLDNFYEPWEQHLKGRRDLSVIDRDITVRADARSWGRMNVRQLFGKRQSIDGTPTGNSGLVNLGQNVGNTAGCPTQKKVALVGVAADCNYVSQFSSKDDARSNIINQFNTVSKLYESTFKISIGIANLTITEKDCPSTAASATPWNVGCSPLDITSRLSAFSGWRAQQVDANAYWMLLSNCPTGDEVGLSWTGALCRRDSEGNNATGANVVMKTSTEWQVMAHETGHTFGAVHDCDSSACQNTNFVNSQQCCPVSSTSCDAGGQFIMNPSINSNSVNKFSPCTVGNVCGGMNTKATNTTCLLDNVKVPLISAQQCGNGIVEEGEDCDCGGTQSCGSNACCDPTTCKFKNNAVCDDSNESCCKSCQFASSGTTCRTSTGSCDPAETCSGTSGTCPSDSFAPDGQDCGNGNQCASGQCTSRTLQCRQIMGTSLTNGKNDTESCDDQGCQISCKAPEFGANVCYNMQQNFLDGTTCGGDGHCKSGACQGATAGGQITSWIDNNKALVIGVACGVGGLLLLSILCCIISACRRKRTVRRIKTANAAGWNGSGYAMAPQHSPTTSRTINAWPAGPGVQQGGNWYGHTNGHEMGQYGYGGQSVRYA